MDSPVTPKAPEEPTYISEEEAKRRGELARAAPRVNYGTTRRVQCPFCPNRLVLTNSRAGYEQDQTLPAEIRLNVVYSPTVALAAGYEVYLLTCPRCHREFVGRWDVVNQKDLEKGAELRKEFPERVHDAQFAKYFVPRRAVVGVTYADFMAEVESIGNRYIKEIIKRELVARVGPLPWDSVRAGPVPPSEEGSTAPPPASP